MTFRFSCFSMEDNKLLILFSSFLKGIIMVKNFSFEGMKSLIEKEEGLLMWNPIIENPINMAYKIKITIKKIMVYDLYLKGKGPLLEQKLLR